MYNEAAEVLVHIDNTARIRHNAAIAVHNKPATILPKRPPKIARCKFSILQQRVVRVLITEFQ